MISHIPRKRFGQNFLHDTQIIQAIISAIAPKSKQHIVEIGPGTGALTRPLLESNCQLDVIELDRDLIQNLKNLNVGIYNIDVLKFDFKQLMTNGLPLRIVGNLPYNISTPLLFHLLKYQHQIMDMTFMLQKEVVDRMIATPATAEYGRLSVMLQYFCQIEKLFDVSPDAFTPAPKVYSSVAQLIPYSTPPVIVNDEQYFAQLVTKAFAQRRKTLRNNLKHLLDITDIEAVGINPQARAETLTLQQFAQLANYKK